MSKAKQFDCPSCFAPMVFVRGESLFQTCEACMAPIVVPVEIYYEEGEKLASANFASLINDKNVDLDQVTNELTPGESLPDSSIGEEFGLDVVIEKFDVYQEKIGAGSVAEKQEFDVITTQVDEDVNEQTAISQITPKEPYPVVFDLIRSELNAGDKVAAIKIFRDTFGGDVVDVKDAVEAIERGEAVDLSIFQKV